MTRAFCFCVACLTIVAAGAVPKLIGQADQPPDTISGVVLSAGMASAPISGAVVTLAGTGISTSLVTTRDGRFRFRGLRPGEYRLSASKPAYLSMVYGATRPGRAGTMLRLTAGRSIANLSISLPLGAVITGSIRDATAAPIPDLSVFALRLIGRSLEVTGTATTNDIGQYRIFGLPAGTYFVAAASRNFSDGRPLQSLSTAELNERLSVIENPPGSRRGASDTTHPPASYASSPTFYPNATTPARAQSFQLTEASERVADITASIARAGSLEGTVFAQGGGELSEVSLTLDPFGPILPTGLTASPRVTQSPSRGNPHFRIEGILPGTYSLSARGSGLPTAGAKEGSRLWGSGQLEFEGGDIAGVTLPLTAGGVVTGRMKIDGATNGPPVAPVRLSLKMISTNTGAPPTRALVSGGATALVDANGTFSIPDIAPGYYVLVATLPRGLWLRSALIDGDDLADVPLLVEPGRRFEALVTLAGRGGVLSGVLTTSDGRPATDYTVLVTPSEARFWIPNTRRVRAVRPSTDGGFVVPDLPTGDYFVSALTDFEDGDLADVGFLTEASRIGFRVSVVEGQTTAQTIQIAR